jgi:hypothetical protein
MLSSGTIFATANAIAAAPNRKASSAAPLLGAGSGRIRAAESQGSIVAPAGPVKPPVIPNGAEGDGEVNEPAMLVDVGPVIGE